MINVVSQEVDEKTWVSDLSEFKYSLLITPECINSMSNEKAIPLYLNLVQGENIIGKISGLICDKGKLKGKQLFFYASPAIKIYSQELFDTCHTAIYNFAKSKGYSRIILGSYDQQHQLSCKAPDFFITTRFEYIVDLTPEELVFDKRFKQNVRRAERNDILFEQNNSPEILNRLFELLQITQNHRAKKYGNEYNPFFLWEMIANH